MSERCPICDLPTVPGVVFAEAAVMGVKPSAVYCWRRHGTPCGRPPVDWRARALKAEKELEKPAPLRGSGRTTRMLYEAAEIAGNGQSVFLVFANQQQADDIRRTFLKTWPLLERRVTFGASEIFDWRALRCPFRPADEICLVDHFAIEKAFQAASKMLHRWDAPAEVGIDWRARALEAENELKELREHLEDMGREE